MKVNIFFLVSLVLILYTSFVISEDNDYDIGYDTPDPKKNDFEKIFDDVLNEARDVTIIGVHAALCSIPLLGAAIDGIFSTVLHFVLPGNSDTDRLERKMDEMMNKMTNYTLKEVDNGIRDHAKSLFESLRIPVVNFKDIQSEWKDKLNANGEVSVALQTNIISQFWILINTLEQVLEQFSHPTRIHVTGHAMLELAPLLIAAYRDAIYYGNKMGLPESFLNHTNSDTKTFEDKINDVSNKMLNKYALMLNSLVQIQNERSTCTENNKNRCPSVYKLPKLSGLVSLYYFSNSKRYKKKVYYIDERSTNLDRNFDIVFTLSKPQGSIYHIDWHCLVGVIDTTHYIKTDPDSRLGQTSDFITGTPGFYYYYEHNLFQRTNFHVTFKFGKPNGKYKLRIFYSLPETDSQYIKGRVDNLVEIELGSGNNEFYYGKFHLTKKEYKDDSSSVTRISKDVGIVRARYVFETRVIEIDRGYDQAKFQMSPIGIFDMMMYSLELEEVLD